MSEPIIMEDLTDMHRRASANGWGVRICGLCKCPMFDKGKGHRFHAGCGRKARRHINGGTQ